MPNAPGLFSTTNDWPRLCRICSATMRVTMSVAPPGPYGTTIFTGLTGYLSCADAVAATAKHASAPMIQPIRFMVFLPELMIPL